jgi:GR25 family glycosyltransferase involved in LPS biosynthesis
MKLFSAILSIKDSDAGFETQQNIKENLGIEVPVVQFERAKGKHFCDKTHSATANHIKLVRQALSNNADYALIFEDDARIYKDRNSKELFNYMLNNLSTLDFEIFFLGCQPLVGSIIWEVRNNIYKVPLTTCLHGYILSRKGMKKLLSLKFPTNKDDDPLCFKYISYNQIDFKTILLNNNYTVYPPICYQNACPTGFDIPGSSSTLGLQFGKGCDHAKVQDRRMWLAIYIKYLYIILFFYYCINYKIKQT